MKTLLLILWAVFLFQYGFAQESLNARLLTNVKLNNLDSVKLLVEAGADVNHCDSNKTPVLMWATLKGDLNMVKYLVSKGADVTRKGRINDPAFKMFTFGNLLGIAVVRRDTALLGYFIDECCIPVDDRENDAGTSLAAGWTPLAYALDIIDTAIIKYLIRKDKKLTISELYSICSYLHLTYPQLTRKQIESAKVNALDRRELLNLLFLAIRNNDTSMLLHVLKAKPDLSELNRDTLSPLAFSIVLNHPEISGLLMKHGAPVNQKCYDGKTPLFFAVEIGDTVLFDDLLKQGALIDVQDIFGRTPLFYSILLENIHMAVFILSKNANPAIPTVDCDFPAFLAFELGHKDFSRTLQQKASFNPACKRIFQPTLLLPPSKTGFTDLQKSKDDRFLLGKASSYSYIFDLSQDRIVRFYKPAPLAYMFFKNSLVSLSMSGQYTFQNIIRNERTKKLATLSASIYFKKTSRNGERFCYFMPSDDDTVLLKLQCIEHPGYSKENFIILDLESHKLIDSVSLYNVWNSNDGNTAAFISHDTLFFSSDHFRTRKFLYRSNVFTDSTERSTTECYPSNDGKLLLIHENFDLRNNFGHLMLDSLSLINPVNLEKIFKIPGLCKKAGFSDNDKYVAILMDNKQKKNFSLLDARDYKFDTILFLESVLDFCFTSSYKQIYLSFSGGGLKVYDVEKKSMQTLYEGNVLSPLMIYADTAGEIFVASSPNKLVSWTLQNGSFHQFRNVPEGIVFKDVSFGGTRSGCLVKDKTDRSIWYMDLSSPDTSENKLFRFPKTLKYPVTFSLLKNQNRWMLCDNFCVKFISFDGLRTDSIVPDSGYRLIDYSLSGDGRYIAFLAIDSTVKLNYFSRLSNYKCQIIVVDSRSHRVFSKIDPQGRVDDISFAVGPANIWLAFHNGFLEQYSVDGKLLTRNLPIPEYRTLLQDENAPGIFHPNSLKFIKTESARLVYLRTTNEIVLVDALEEKVVKRLKMPLNFKDPVVLNNEKWVLFPSDGGGIKIIDIASTKEICTLYYLDSTDYVVLAPNGIFDATPGAMKKMSFLAGMESVDLSQLKYRYYQPGLLPILLGYKDEGLREVPAFDFIRLFPKMELAVKDSKLSISLRNRGGGIGKVSVSISNIQIIDDARLSADDSSRSEISLSVDLAQYSKFFRYDTTNVIRVLAWNAEGYLSSRPDTVHYAPPSSGKGMKYVARDKNGNRIIPHLYALIVGTSDYAGQQIDLQYPAKDAEAFSSALAVGAERLFGKDHVQVKLLASGTKEEPTIDNIRKEMETMTQASPDDIVVLYFSGHGINYGGQDGMFYYLTMGAEGLDAVYLNDPVFRSTKAISSQEIANSLNKIPAQKKVLILDACSSGRAADNLLASLTKDIPSSQKRALEFTQDATGAYLLASSAANTVSYESPIYEHGLLTYTLLQGMHGGQLTKIESDEYVDVEKLFMYAKNEVPKLAFDINGVQDPVMRTPGAKGSLYIGKLTEEDKMRIVLPEPKAVFLPCVFTNASEDLAAEELDIGERLNERLDQLSAKGKDSRISFTRAAAYPDAWIIKGKYLLKGSEITVTYILKKGSRIMLPQQTETVPLTKLDSLLDNIISNVKKTSAVK